MIIYYYGNSIFKKDGVNLDGFNLVKNDNGIMYEYVEQHSNQTADEIARGLGWSLEKVNAILKEHLEEGTIKAVRGPNNEPKYIYVDFHDLLVERLVPKDKQRLVRFNTR